MAAEVNKKFLDYAGLQKLWGIITGRFADKNAAVSTISFEPISYTPDGETSPVTTQQLITTMVDGTTKKAVNMPHASRTQAGLMSPEQFAIVNDIEHNIEDMAPFAGLKLVNGDDANEVSLLDRKANIELKYITEPDKNGITNKAFIALVDSNYPEGGNWTESDEAGYNAATDKSNWHAWRQPNGTYKYYYWSETGKIGPINALGEPIMQQAISKIDVTELVKTGLLEDSDVVIDPEGQNKGTYLKLIFNTYNAVDGSYKADIQYINVTDLVEIYTAGEGIKITDEANTDADDIARTGKINVIAATDTTLGAFKTGYTEGNKTYAIKLDTNNKAYVAVPWNETVVTAGTPATNNVENGIYGVDADNKPYLKVSCTPTPTKNDDDNSTTTTYAISVAAGEGIKQANELARTSVQNIVGDNNYININAGNEDGKPTNLSGKGTQWSISLDQAAKDSLAYADSAVQSIEATQFSSTDRPHGSVYENDIVVTASANAAQKGQKTYTIALGERTKKSLNLADSALQEITIMGTKLSETDPVYSVDGAKKVMALGSAAGVNVSEDATLETAISTVTYVEENKVDTEVTKNVNNVPTVSAVKTYVDNTASDIKTKYETLVANTIASLDSTASAGVTAAADTAQEVEAKRIFTKIVIKDGKLVAPGATGEDADPVHGTSVAQEITITDIVDFRALTKDEIEEICI